MLTLAALSLMQCFYYGVRAVVLSGICIAVSIAAELISLRLMKRKFTADDLTCVSDAMILSLMLPAAVDYRIAAIACVFAVVIAKNLFGGRKNMIFSPAAAAYVFLLASWKKDVLMFTAPHVHTGVFDKASELVSSASHNFNTTGKMNATDFEILMGNISGPAGAVSILLLMVAALILLLRRDISSGAFFGAIVGTVFLAAVAPMSATVGDSVKYTLVSNMILFAAIYVISDRRIAPRHNYYAFFYGFFIAVFSYIFVLTTAKENAVMIVSVLFTPVALGLKNLEKRIDDIAAKEREAALSVSGEEETADE